MLYEIIDDFLTQEECNQIVSMAKPRLQRSMVWDFATSSSKIDDYRNSEQMFFAVKENPLVAKIEERIANLTGFPIENGEGLQVVFYRSGGYFKPHVDAFDPRSEGNRSVFERGGQRLVTILIYLNDMYNSHVEDGGETYFPKIDLLVKPKKGKAVLWANVDENGIIDETSFHEGRPVPEGCEKIIMTKWIRSDTFR